MAEKQRLEMERKRREEEEEEKARRAYEEMEEKLKREFEMEEANKLQNSLQVVSEGNAGQHHLFLPNSHFLLAYEPRASPIETLLHFWDFLCC